MNIYRELRGWMPSLKNTFIAQRTHMRRTLQQRQIMTLVRRMVERSIKEEMRDSH